MKSPYSKVGTSSSFLVNIVIKGIVVQLVKIQKFSQCHIECQSDLVKSFDSGILGKTTDDIVQGGLLYITHNCELVDRNSSILAQFSDSFHIELRIFHNNPLTVIFTHLRVSMMITRD